MYEKNELGKPWSSRAAVDWFPFANNSRFFVSAGLDYTEGRSIADADSSESYNIGDQVVNPGDNITTSLEIERNFPLSVFLGAGWGNRIGSDKGFSFLAEFGLLLMSSDVDVTLDVTDPENQVSEADIENERKRIESDIENVGGLLSFGFLYHF